MRFLLSVLVFAMLAVGSFAFQNQHDIIQFVNNAKTTWTAGVNDKFDGADMLSIKRLMGTFKTPKDLRLPLKPASQINTILGLPDNFDSRQQWPNCPTLKEIRDQSACGSCWAFATTEAATDRICIHSNATVNYHLSATDLLSCCDSCGNGCDGGFPGSAWQYLQDTGIATGGNYNDFSKCVSYPFPPCAHHVTSPDYQPCPSSDYNTPQCQQSCDSQSTYTTPYSSDLRQFKSAYSVASDPAAIMNEIYQHGPVGAAFTVYEDLLTYKSGVYQHTTGNMLGGHAIKIIGWGVENNTPYWTVVNSWNPTWGDNGTFKIIRGNDECGIEDEIVAGMFM